MLTIIDEDGLEIAKISMDTLTDIAARIGHDAVIPSADEWKPPKKWAPVPKWKQEGRTGL